MELARRIIEEGLTVRDIEKIVKKAAVEKDKKTKKAPETKDPLLLDIEERLKMVLGTQVRIKNGRNKGKIEIEYYSGEDLERIIEIFLKNNI
jgi:ParB family chromosome partitioning protein